MQGQSYHVNAFRGKLVAQQLGVSVRRRGFLTGESSLLLFLQPAQVSSEELVNGMPEAPVQIGLLVVERPIFTKYWAVTNDVAGEPTQDRN